MIMTGFSLHAQIGINTTTPRAALDIISTNEDMLIPRVALLSTAVLSPINSVTAEASELVFNTATAGSGATAVTPGCYYLNPTATSWIRLGNDSLGGESDNLGNHTATTPLNMSSNNIINAAAIQGTTNLSLNPNSDNVRIGNNNPLYKLDVNGTTKTTGFVIPTSALAVAVLISDSNGAGTWQASAINNVVGFVGGLGIDIPHNTTQYIYTGDYIILPLGRYAVNVSMLMTIQSGGVTFITPPNSSFWVRSTFSDNLVNLTKSPDI